MNRFIRKIFESLEQRIDLLPSDIDDKSRRLFYFVFVIIGPPIMLLFGTKGLLAGDVFVFCALILLTFGVIGGWVYLLKTRNAILAYRINSFVYAVILVYILFIGGQEGSKLLWAYTFPLIVIFLLGKTEGAAWCIAYLFAALVIIYSDWPGLNKYVYHPEFKLRFFITYTLVSAISYWFEYLRNEYRIKLEIKNSALEQQIEQKKKIQGELEESEELFRLIFDQAGVGVSLTCSETGKLLKVNKKYCDILGYSAEELEKKTFQKITHPEDLAPDLKKLEELRAGKIDSYSMEKRHFASDGRTIWVILSVTAIPGKNQHIGVIQDITPRKLLEAEVKTLEGIIPICSSCKKIRDDEGYWNKIESYIQEHSEASFSHGMCPECADKLYGDQPWYIKMMKEKLS